MKLKLNKNKIFTSLLSFSVFLFFVSNAQAAITNPVVGDLGSEVEGAKSGSLFINYVVYLWKVAINLGALAVIAYFIWGAIEWITSGGDKSKVESARNRITNAVVGLVILVASFTILSFISKIFFGDTFNLLELTLPTYNN